MKIPPLSERPDIEEEEQDFLTPPARRKKRTLADRRAALRPWAIGIGLTVLVATASVGAYTLGAGIDWWNEHPSAAATPTVHPAPMPSASSEAAMSGGYAIGPDGVLVRPAEFAADTYTKPELPETAKENTERGAELAAEYLLDTLSYAWNTGDTQPFAGITEPGEEFREGHIKNINALYRNGWMYGNRATVTNIVSVLPVSPEEWGVQPNTIAVVFDGTANNGISCVKQRLIDSNTDMPVTFAFFMTWKDGAWISTGGAVSYADSK